MSLTLNPPSKKHFTTNLSNNKLFYYKSAANKVYKKAESKINFCSDLTGNIEHSHNYSIFPGARKSFKLFCISFRLETSHTIKEKLSWYAS